MRLWAFCSYWMYYEKLDKRCCQHGALLPAVCLKLKHIRVRDNYLHCRRCWRTKLRIPEIWKIKFTFVVVLHSSDFQLATLHDICVLNCGPFVSSDIQMCAGSRWQRGVFVLFVYLLTHTGNRAAHSLSLPQSGGWLLHFSATLFVLPWP